MSTFVPALGFCPTTFPAATLVLAREVTDPTDKPAFARDCVAALSVSPERDGTETCIGAGPLESTRVIFVVFAA